MINQSNITGAVSHGAQVQALNQLSNGLFGLLLLVVIMIIVFAVMRTGSDKNDLVVMSFVFWFGIIVAVMLRVLGMIHEGIIIVLIILSLASTVLVAYKT